MKALKCDKCGKKLREEGNLTFVPKGKTWVPLCAACVRERDRQEQNAGGPPALRQD